MPRLPIVLVLLVCALAGCSELPARGTLADGETAGYAPLKPTVDLWRLGTPGESTRDVSAEGAALAARAAALRGRAAVIRRAKTVDSDSQARMVRALRLQGLL
jgi:hypothetical protein